MEQVSLRGLGADGQRAGRRSSSRGALVDWIGWAVVNGIWWVVAGFLMDVPWISEVLCGLAFGIMGGLPLLQFGLLLGLVSPTCRVSAASDS